MDLQEHTGGATRRSGRAPESGIHLHQSIRGDRRTGLRRRHRSLFRRQDGGDPGYGGLKEGPIKKRVLSGLDEPAGEGGVQHLCIGLLRHETDRDHRDRRDDDGVEAEVEREFVDHIVPVAEHAAGDEACRHGDKGAFTSRAPPVQAGEEGHCEGGEHDPDARPDQPGKHFGRVDGEEERPAGRRHDRDPGDEECLAVARLRPEEVLPDVPGKHRAHGEHQAVGRRHHGREHDDGEERPDPDVGHGVFEPRDEDVVLGVRNGREGDLPLLDKGSPGKSGELDEEHDHRVDGEGDQGRPLEVPLLLCGEDVVDDVRGAGKAHDEHQPEGEEECRREGHALGEVRLDQGGVDAGHHFIDVRHAAGLHDQEGGDGDHADDQEAALDHGRP